MSSPIGVRLNSKTDQDIIAALSNAKNKSKEIKRLLRLAIQAERYFINQTVPVIKPPPPPKKKVELPKAESKMGDIEANILAGFDS